MQCVDESPEALQEERWSESCDDAVEIAGRAANNHARRPGQIEARSPSEVRETVENSVLHPCTEHRPYRSEEHMTEHQSPCNLVCRLLLEKKKKKNKTHKQTTTHKSGATTHATRYHN